MASGASNAATAAAEPPPEPPGIRSRSHGLRVGPYAECSVEEPIANSSMLVLPRIGRPAARRRATTVASYGGIQPSRIFDPHVVGQAAGGQHVLDRDRHAVERAQRPRRGRGGRRTRRPGEGALGVDVEERVHGRVDRRDPVEVRPG